MERTIQWMDLDAATSTSLVIVKHQWLTNGLTCDLGNRNEPVQRL